MKKTSSGADHIQFHQVAYASEDQTQSPLAHRHINLYSSQVHQAVLQQHAGHQPQIHMGQHTPQHSKPNALLGWPQLGAPVGPRESFPFSQRAILSGVVYSISSAALTLFNKKVLVAYDFHAVHSLLCFHCALAAFLVRLFTTLRLVPPVEPLTGEVLRIWLPLNLVFVGMLATNFYALQTVGVAMVSVLKNLSNLFILAGDFFLFRRTYNWQCWLCLALMTASACAGGATDLHFSWHGYAWQMVNNAFTAAYALHLSSVTERLASLPYTPGEGEGGGVSRRRSELSMVYYNNLLSVPFTLALAVIHGEHTDLLGSPALRDPSFQLFSFAGGLLGFALSYSSIQFVSLTSATIYSLVGSMNKLLVAMAAVWMFGELTEPLNVISVAVGLAAGTLLPFVKMRSLVSGAPSTPGGSRGGGDAGGNSSKGISLMARPRSIGS